MSGAPSKGFVHTSLICLSVDLQRIAAEVLQLAPGNHSLLLLAASLTAAATVADEGARTVMEMQP